jgi:hypothetical protein
MAPFMGTTNTFRHHVISRIIDGSLKHIGKQSLGAIDLTTYLRVAKNKRWGKHLLDIVHDAVHGKYAFYPEPQLRIAGIPSACIAEPFLPMEPFST